jgi:hypothetical protein
LIKAFYREVSISCAAGWLMKNLCEGKNMRNISEGIGRDIPWSP